MSSSLIVIIALAVILAGTVVAWIVTANNAKAGFRIEKGGLESQLSQANQRAADLEGQLAEAKEETRRQVQAAREESDNLHKKSMEELEQRFNVTISKVSAEMEAKTGQMLQARQKEFSELSSLSLKQIMDPLKQDIDNLKKTMSDDAKEQIGLKAQMQEQVKQMMQCSEAARKSADDLAAAFMHGSKMQGDWGETILEELLASQGLKEGIHFETQHTMADTKGATLINDNNSSMRLDVVLHLDETRDVIIDSKVSLTAYVQYVNAENDEDRKKYLKAHVDSIKKHVTELTKKDYSSYVKPPHVSAEYVIMFVPHAGALWTALQEDHTLWRWAANQDILISDEQTLYGALRMVSTMWKQVQQVQNQKKVYELADEMVKRVGMFLKHYNDLGEALQRLSDSYADGQKKLAEKGQSIVSTSKKLIDLGADGKQLVSVSSNRKVSVNQLLDDAQDSAE